MHLAFAFGGPMDWVIIFVIALVLFGPKKLPEIGQQLGKAVRELRKVTDEFTGTAHSVRDEFESVLKTEHKPVATPRTTVRDQEPHDLMAPANPDREAPGLVLSTVPPEPAHGDAETEKGR
jgi:sec-independent protein translocase protein TatA